MTRATKYLALIMALTLLITATPVNLLYTSSVSTSTLSLKEDNLGKGKMTSSAAIYEKSGEKGKQLGTAAKGTAVTLHTISDSYAQVTVDKMTGYVPLRSINVRLTMPISVALQKKASIYKTTSASSKNLLGTVNKGVKVTLIGRSGSWWVIDYKGKNSYVQDANIKWPANAAPAATYEPTETPQSTATPTPPSSKNPTSPSAALKT